MIEVKGVIRDPKSGAIVSKQSDRLLEYKEQKKRMRQKDNRISELESRLSNIEKMLEQVLSSQASN